MHPNAVLPKRQTGGAAGYDLYAVEDLVLESGLVFRVPLGFKAQPPKGWCILSIARSGLALEGVTYGNGVGLIDSDYGGQMHILLANYGTAPFAISAGDRIGQMIVVPAYTVEFDEVPEGTIEGRGGFGSTGA